MAWLKRNANRLWLVLILLAVGGVLALIDQRGELLSPGPLPDSSEGEPDYYLEQVVYTRFDQQGRPYQTLESPRVTHISDSDVSFTDTPVIGLIDENERHWRITGDRGRVGPGGDRITLSGNARAVQPDDLWRLETDTLEYDRDSARVWSDSESRFFQGEQRTRGDRFQAWINEDRMLLEGNVSGTLLPER
ncbi:LPS export ABC transporter periplasmic protein LptC [Halotalea alkalilenta]|uniref:LPS export ABC transporter periplasmic protein LptC n=1 Tax=Halotalea alkalilenta TaxID=376489 RepID=UPI000484503A|nr:LPS export ABC transporter periplasmic protein LptC [Halotalea alkalilenta]